MRQAMMGFGMQWHQLDHMQAICTSLHTDRHANTSSLTFMGQMLFTTPNQQRQRVEGSEWLVGFLKKPARKL